MHRIMMALALLGLASGVSAAKPKGPTKEQVAEYDKAVALVSAKDLPGALKIFEALCGNKIPEACQNVEIVKQEQARLASETAQNAESARITAAFDAALAKRNAKDYEGAIADFGVLCKQQLASACQNEAAVSLEQSTELLKAAKRPNGQDCSQAIVASDFCRPAMTKSVELLGRICQPTSEVQAIKAVCNRRSQLQTIIAATDKQLGKSN